jgi:hypothetical protein
MQFAPASGFVLVDIKVDCALSAEMQNRGGEVAGLDCFLQFSFEIRSAKC